MLRGKFDVFLSNGDNCAQGVSILVDRSLDADIHIVQMGGHLAVADISGSSGFFRQFVVYAPKN